MTKREVSQRVLQNGKPLGLDKFSWDRKTKTFSTIEDKLVIDFNGINDCTFKTGSSCTFKTGFGCTFDTSTNCIFKTGSDCTFNCGWNCTFNCAWNCTFKTETGCTFKTDTNCTFKTDSFCTFKTGSNCTFNTSHDCTFKTGSDCTFNCGWNCIFKTDTNCIFKTDSYCTFKTDSFCTFKTGSNCTFNTSHDCTFDNITHSTFNTGSYCAFDAVSDSVIVRRDYFEVIIIGKTKSIKLLPKGRYIEKLENQEFYHYPNETEEIVLIDKIVSKVISRKGNVLKVINLGETDESFIISNGLCFAHGKTLKEAKESLIYKISDRDLSEFSSYNLETKVTFKEGVKMYRKITGSCESETREFAKDHKFKDTKSIKEIIELTHGQYNNNLVVNYFKDKIN